MTKEIFLNPRLVKQQGLTDVEVDEIKNLHSIRETLFENMRGLKSTKPDELDMIRHGAVELRELEFALQRAWRFEESANWHSWWYQMPHCRCPKMDNMDMLGTGLTYISHDCPVHYPTPYTEENS